jgi:hypothetical protein
MPAEGEEIEMTKTSRFVIEGTWSGYTSAQKKVAHRNVYSSARRKLRSWAESTHAIYYTDGTSLYLSVRDCKPRERIETINGYESLIQDCFFYGVNSVDALVRSRGGAA